MSGLEELSGPGPTALRVRACLERYCPGSTTLLRGSLAHGTADVYSDMDVEWQVPAARFAPCVREAGEALAPLAAVHSVRADPDHAREPARRLLFVRFRELPLFWRLDLLVCAAADGPAEAPPLPPWSLPASAAENAIAAVKALRRHRTDTAFALLDRGFRRIEARPPSAPAHWAEDWAAVVEALAWAAARQEPALAGLAEETGRLAHRLLDAPQA